MAPKTEAEPTAGDTPAGGGRRKKLLLAAPVVVLLAAAAFFFVLKPGSSQAQEKPKPVPGAVVQLEPITVNLAGGHFLKVGLALQPTAAAGEVTGAQALDLAIELFSGRTIADLSSREGREKSKALLVREVARAYEDKVYDVYFTTFVMQ